MNENDGPPPFHFYATLIEIMLLTLKVTRLWEGYPRYIEAPVIMPNTGAA